MTGSGTIFYARYSSSRVLIELVGIFARSRGAGQFWVWETKLKLQGILWGKVGMIFNTLNLDEMKG